MSKNSKTSKRRKDIEILRFSITMATWIRNKEYKKLSILKRIEFLDKHDRLKPSEKLERVENLYNDYIRRKNLKQ